MAFTGTLVLSSPLMQFSIGYWHKVSKMITKIFENLQEYLYRSLEDTHEGNPFCIFTYYGNTSSDSEEVVNLFTPGTLFTMANELLT